MEDNFEFQILEWDEHQYCANSELGSDDSSDNDSDSSSDNDGKPKYEKDKMYMIRLFGKTKDQKSVYLEVTEFKPYFFVEIPAIWNTLTINSYIERMKESVYPKFLAEDMIKHSIIKSHKFIGFTDYTKFNFLKLEFNNIDALRAYERCIKKITKVCGKFFTPKIYESNLLPMLRMMHIKNINAVGTICIDKQKLSKNTVYKSCNDHNYSTKWINIIAKEEHLIEKYVILGFDIECTSKDGSFPQPDREEDKITQIGMTLSKYGENDCYEKYLLALHETADIEGCIVKWYNTEEELLLGFTNMLREINPDIITGYNIFGFDWAYIKGRVEKLKSMIEIKKNFVAANNFAREVEKLSRIDDEVSFWKKDGYPLSSGAMGVNLFYFYKMTGRIQIDLMKVAQREFKLSSYKLDYVAASFIRDNIVDIQKLENKKAIYCDTVNTHSNENISSDFVSGDINGIQKAKDEYKITTKGTFGVTVGNFITIGYYDGAVEERYEGGKKFEILKMEKNSFTISGNINTEEFIGKGYKVFWTQAKDDVSPKDIFRLCNGTPEDRAIVGKYCVQDCALCNKLMAKLQIITNNVGMANVCHVPFSFLFLRGQGIKIFSLVAKKCKEEDHLIPVLKKPKSKDEKEKEKEKTKTYDELSEKQLDKHIENLNKKNYDNGDNGEGSDEDDDGYEGAIVFVPKPGVYFEPIPVLDYASLYPNSMRMRNLSHECFVNDPKYDNLPNYIYHEISYKNNNGTSTTCRFAEKKDGSKGIIPCILTDLLNARKKYKKMMDNETDGFKKSVLNGLQLAYKVTANSLYGQTGASTSSIRMKEIAASTTATGREMLQFSKYFIENIYYEIINASMLDLECTKTVAENYLNVAKNYFLYYPTKFKTKDDDGNDMEIHVNTCEKQLIPEAKFCRKEIGYEVKMNFIKDLENTDSILDFDKLIEELYNISPVIREKILEIIKKKPGKIKTKNYSKYENIWNKIGINNVEDLENKITELNKKDVYELIIKKFEIELDDIGYKNKEHFFEKMHVTMKKLLEGYSVKPEIIYGDTDSVFFCPHIKDLKTGEMQKDYNSLCISIRLGIWASIIITTMLPAPMAQEYEKVLYPFIIQGKKRYVGNLYEKDPKSFSQKSMGIELKRRDNAPIVKTVSAGIIGKILNERNPKGAFTFMKEILEQIIRGKFKMDKFVITKTLKGNALTKKEREIESKKPKEERYYADRTRIVHAVLADRMADRDPGSKPLSNDRIPYAYIETDYEPELQGDKVETPEFIIENNLKLDYLFYITNQIMKPALKFLELINPDAKELFDDYIAREQNRRKGTAPIGFYCNTEKKSDEENDDLLNLFNKPKAKICKKKNNSQAKKPTVKKFSEMVCFDDLD